MAKYMVIGSIKTDKGLLPLNKPADFDDEDADALVRDGYLKPVSDADLKKSGKKAE